MYPFKKLSWKWSLFFLGVILLAANLRASIVAVGPITNELLNQLHLSEFTIGLITTIPLLCFSLGSIYMPKIAEKRGLEKVLLFSIVILSCGILIRSIGTISFLFLGSIVLGLAITAANVLIPPFIKKYFPKNVGFVTAFYLGFINIFSAIAVAYSVRLGKIGDLGWRASLGFWFLLALVALPFWIYIYVNRKRAKTNATTHISSSKGIWKSKLAWYISIFMAMQSIMYYVFAAWLPSMLEEWGMASENTGWVLFYLQSSNVPALIITPFLAVHKKAQIPLILLATIMMLSALTFIYFWRTDYIILSSMLMGAAIGIIYAIATTFFVIKTSSVHDSLQLSGMAQTVCYLITGIFPPLTGFLHGITNSWDSSIIMLFIIPIVMIMTGVLSVKGKEINLQEKD